MNKIPLARLPQYISALVLIALATQGTSMLDASSTRAPLGLFYAAVVLCAWYGGIGPALIATLLALFSIHYYFMPSGPSAPSYAESAVLLMVLGGVAILISYLTVSRQRAERALQFQESTTLSSLSRVKDIILAVDSDWCVTYMNRYFNGYEGRAISDFTGHSLWKIYPRLVGSDFENECRKAMADGKPAHFQERKAIPGKRFDVRLYPGEDGLSILCIDTTGNMQQGPAENNLDHKESISTL